MLVQGVNNKKHNRELCVTLRYEKNVEMHDSNGFEVYNLWYIYVVMKCL